MNNTYIEVVVYSPSCRPTSSEAETYTKGCEKAVNALQNGAKLVEVKEWVNGQLVYQVDYSV